VPTSVTMPPSSAVAPATYHRISRLLSGLRNAHSWTLKISLFPTCALPQATHACRHPPLHQLTKFVAARGHREDLLVLLHGTSYGPNHVRVWLGCELRSKLARFTVAQEFLR
jgi:hypothetical protein